MGGEVNKVHLEVAGRHILEYSLIAARAFSRFERLIVVVREGDETTTRHLIERLNLSARTTMVHGGESRHGSECAGMDELRSDIVDGRLDLVGIHDGARPFLTVRLLASLVALAGARGGAIPGSRPAQLLYKRTAAGLEFQPTRDLRIVQTPQVFHAHPLLMAYDASREAGFEGTDTAEVVERFSDLEVVVTPSDPRNLKVTFPADLVEAEHLAHSWRDGAWRAAPPEPGDRSDDRSPR